MTMPFKKLFYTALFFSSLPFFVTAKESIFFPDNLNLQEAKKIIKQKKELHEIECAFDIHEVLLQKNKQEQIALAYSFDHKSLFMKNLFNLPLLTQLGALFWHWVLDISPLHARKAEATSEQLVVIFNDAQQYELSHFVTRLANAQIVDKEMIPILKELKAQGYTLHVASNIGKTVYEELKIILQERDENIFELFDKDARGNEGKVVDYAHSQASKPSDQYFLEYIADYNPDLNKLIIFIDDKKKNIRAAIKHGMIGIHFFNAKRLKKDLQILGLLD